MAIHTIRAVLFDVFGTVVDWRSGVAREAGPFLARHGALADAAGAFADAWRRKYGPAMEEVRSGRRPFVRLDVLHRENLLAILPEFGVDPGRVPGADIERLNSAWHRLDPWPDAPAALHRLKSRYIIGPLSNANISMSVNMAKFAGLPWDVILGAEVAQAYKPTPESYLRSALALDLEPSQVCLVAAHNGDLAGAQRCGLRTAFVPRLTEHGPAQSTDLAASGEYDLVAADFTDLAEKLGC